LINDIATRTARSAGSTAILSSARYAGSTAKILPKGFNETDKLTDVLRTLDEPSLSRLIRDHQAGTLEGKIRQHS
jgi:hypothetical protein